MIYDYCTCDHRMPNVISKKGSPSSRPQAVSGLGGFEDSLPAGMVAIDLIDQPPRWRRLAV